MYRRVGADGGLASRLRNQRQDLSEALQQVVSRLYEEIRQLR